MSLDANLPTTRMGLLGACADHFGKGWRMRRQRLGRIEAYSGTGGASFEQGCVSALSSVGDRLWSSPPRRDIVTRLNMTDTDKIVAATFAVARCGGLGHSKPEDYIAEYDSFLRLLNERESDTAERAVKVDPVSPWKFGT